MPAAGPSEKAFPRRPRGPRKLTAAWVSAPIRTSSCLRCSSRSAGCSRSRPRCACPYRSCSCSAGSCSGFVPGHPPHHAAAGRSYWSRVLPPLLYSGRSSPRCATCGRTSADRARSPSGSSLATMAAVALVCPRVDPGFPGRLHSCSGAIVSPTDAVAATEIASRLGLPRARLDHRGREPRSTTRPRSSSTGRGRRRRHGIFSLFDASARFILNVVGGIAVGLAVGWLVRQVRRRLDELADRDRDRRLSRLLRLPARGGRRGLGRARSGHVGIYMGWYTPELTTEQTRLQGDAVWEILVFMLNALLFVLVGLQLRTDPRHLAGIARRDCRGRGAGLAAR